MPGHTHYLNGGVQEVHPTKLPVEVPCQTRPLPEFRLLLTQIKEGAAAAGQSWGAKDGVDLRHQEAGRSGSHRPVPGNGGDPA